VRLTRPRAILFDWDNTLVDSFGVIHIALNETLAAMGHETWTYDDTCRQIARSMRDFFPTLFDDRWEAARDLFYTSYRKHHLQHIQPMPGAADLLDAVRDAGIYLALVSNKSGVNLRIEIDHLGWQDYFDRAVGAFDAEEDKPSTKAVDLALEGSGISRGGDVWFVGDNAVDIECAEAAGCVPMLMRGAVTTGHEPGPERTPWRFENCAELAAIVRAL